MDVLGLAPGLPSSSAFMMRTTCTRVQDMHKTRPVQGSGSECRYPELEAAVANVQPCVAACRRLASFVDGDTAMVEHEEGRGTVQV
jgi:hypothetical protein